MDNDYKWVENILDRDKLINNLTFAGIFIAYFERMQHTAKEKLSSFFTDSGTNYVGVDFSTYESESFRQKVLSLSKKKYDAIFQWFANNKAIDDHDLEIIQIARNRRNEIAHHIDNFLMIGVQKDDITLLSELLIIYSQLDRWWINEIEIPTAPIEGFEKLEDFDPSQFFSSEALILKVIYDIAAGENLEAYQVTLEKIRGSFTEVKK